MADVDKDKSAPARKPSVEEAHEACDKAIAERERARANPNLSLPFGDPRRRRAQRRFDAACLACDAACRVAHSHYLLSVAAGEICAHLYLIAPRTMFQEGPHERLADETTSTLAIALPHAGFDGPQPPPPMVQWLDCEHQGKAEAILREHEPVFGERIDDFKAGKLPVLKAVLVAYVDDPCSVALMALHRREALH
jgi:hypothetical protein